MKWTMVLLALAASTGDTARVKNNKGEDADVEQAAVDPIPPSSDSSTTWCVALSGNGGNWGSTLGFLSEALLLYVAERNPKAFQQKINLRCAVGGSSGAATTVLLSSLLSNPSFGVSSDGLATPAQAVSIARALAVVAQTVDLGPLETAQTASTVAKTKFADWGKHAWKKNIAALDMPATLVQFGRAIALAKHMPSDWSELDVADMIKNHCGAINFGIFRKAGQKAWCHREKLLQVAKDYGLQQAVDLPKRIWKKGEEPSKTYFKEDVDSDKKEELQTQLTLIMKDISSHLIDLSKKYLELLGFTFGMQNGIDVESKFKANMVDEILAEKPEEGFITVTFVQPRTDPEQSLEGLDYTKTRVLAMMARATAEAILQSQSYQRQISACLQKDVAGCQRADRYILATVDTMRPMITLPTMEPGMGKPYIATMSGLGVMSSFDPKRDQNEGAPFSLRDETISDDIEVDPLNVILGGFLDRGQSVVLQQFYNEGKKRDDVQFTLFGKNEDPGTAVSAVKDLLSDENSATANWADFKAWAEPRPPTTFIDGELNWDCGASLPANIRGASWELRLHGAARARAALQPDKEQDIFDPMEACEDEKKDADE